MLNGWSQQQKDDDLEARINAVHGALVAAVDRASRIECALRMADLIGQRSPERIRQMEHDQGLAK